MISRPYISAVILGAGLSSRMGEVNKLLLPFHGQPLVRHVVRTIASVDVDEVLLVVGHQSEAVLKAVEGLNVLPVSNENYAQGMTTSIQAGVYAASDQSDGFMICLSDLPEISRDEYNELVQRFRTGFRSDPEVILQPTFQGKGGNPVIFSAAYRDRILAHREPSGCRLLLEKNRDHVVRHKMKSAHILRDMDTKEAYERLLNA